MPAIYRNQQTSQELQILYNQRAAQRPARRLLSRRQFARRSSTCACPAESTALTFGDVDTETFAIFGDFTYDFSRACSASRSAAAIPGTSAPRTSCGRPSSAGGSPFFGGNGVLFATTSNFNGTADFEEFTPRASVSFHPAEDQTSMRAIRAASRAAASIRAARPRPAATPPAAPATPAEVYDFIAFDPETVTSYELGYRASLFDRRVNLALAVFHADYTRRAGAGLDRHHGRRHADLHRHHHQRRQGALPGRRVRGQCDPRAQTSAPTGDQLSFAWSLGYLNAEYLRVHRRPRHRRRRPAGDPEHARMDG